MLGAGMSPSQHQAGNHYEEIVDPHVLTLLPCLFAWTDATLLSPFVSTLREAVLAILGIIRLSCTLTSTSTPTGRSWRLDLCWIIPLRKTLK